MIITCNNNHNSNNMFCHNNSFKYIVLQTGQYPDSPVKSNLSSSPAFPSKPRGSGVHKAL